MRIRSIKPEFWRSEDIAGLDWADRLLFVGLWSYVDDNGVGRDVPKVIVAELFALEEDPRDTLATVSRGLSNLAAAGLITRYTAGGRPFLHICSWSAHQRIDKPNQPRYPLPTCADASAREDDATPSRQSRDTLAPGAVEQGSSGTGEQGSSGTGAARAAVTAQAGGFDAFYQAYPRKVAKPTAAKAYAKALKRATADVILDGARRYAADPNRPASTYVPYPATWLNDDRWNDGPCPPQVSGRPTTDDKVLAGLSLAQQMRERAQRDDPQTYRQIGA